MTRNNNWKLLIADTNSFNVKLKEALLENNHIKYFVKINQTDSAHGLSFGGEIKIFVLEQEFKKAKQIIEQ